MQQNFTPVKTKYNGYEFRSRLEARWAVFFDYMGVKYLYEHEGYDLGKHGWYLPDFHLPEARLIIEVKPLFSMITQTELSKAGWLRESISSMTQGSYMDVFIVSAEFVADEIQLLKNYGFSDVINLREHAAICIKAGLYPRSRQDDSVLIEAVSFARQYNFGKLTADSLGRMKIFMCNPYRHKNIKLDESDFKWINLGANEY